MIVERIIAKEDGRTTTLDNYQDKDGRKHVGRILSKYPEDKKHDYSVAITLRETHYGTIKMDLRAISIKDKSIIYDAPEFYGIGLNSKKSAAEYAQNFMRSLDGVI